MEGDNVDDLLAVINDNVIFGIETADDIHQAPQRTPSSSSLRAKDLLRHKLEVNTLLYDHEW